MIREALDYPPSGEHGSRAVVIGGLLFLVPVSVEVVLALLQMDSSVALGAVVAFFIAVQILVRGYYVAVLRATVGAHDPVAPPFRGVRLVSDGIKSIGILLVYLVPGLVLGGIGLYARFLSGTGTPGTVIDTGGAFAFLLGLFALLAAAYLVPAAITLFARNNSLRAAFGSPVRACALSEDYAVGWVVAVVVQVVLVPIGIIFRLLLVGFFFQFYVRVSVQHLYAHAVTNALAVDHEETGRDVTATDEHSATGRKLSRR